MKINSETSRIRALLVNSGRYDFEEAERKLRSSRLVIRIENEAARSPAGQAAALTAVLTGARCFPGGVTMAGVLDQPLLLPLPLAVRTLGEAAYALGAVAELEPPLSRTVIIGRGECGTREGAVRAIWNGWSAGVTPAGQSTGLEGRGGCSLSGVAAGALAVCQAFRAEQGDLSAGTRAQGISLWTPEEQGKWWENSGPSEFFLPNALWLIGLGNLGQAYLWALSLLPYADPGSLELFLQDHDLVSEENWGTSILVERGRYDILKTRIAEEWADARHFRVRRVDRKLDEYMHRTDREPGIALAGLDKMEPRRLLGVPGFDYIIDAGLGATASDYSRFRINVFDKSRDPATHFAGVEDTTRSLEEVMRLPAYQGLELTEHAGCGAAELAGQSVAVPFVSALAAALVVAQAVRLSSNQAPHFAISGEINDLRTVRTVKGARPSRMVVGYTRMTTQRPSPGNA